MAGVVPLGAWLQVAGAAIARRAVGVFGEVDRVAGGVGADLPAQFGERHAVGVFHAHAQAAVGWAQFRGVLQAQVEAGQLVGFASVLPGNPEGDQTEAEHSSKGNRQSLGRVANEQNQPGQDKQSADDHGEGKPWVCGLAHPS